MSKDIESRQRLAFLDRECNSVRLKLAGSVCVRVCVCVCVCVRACMRAHTHMLAVGRAESFIRVDFSGLDKESELALESHKLQEDF